MEVRSPGETQGLRGRGGLEKHREAVTQLREAVVDPSKIASFLRTPSFLGDLAEKNGFQKCIFGLGFQKMAQNARR